ncbi:MAG: hypothetical protein ABFS16_12255 [Bacteroidota bacterium]
MYLADVQFDKIDEEKVEEYLYRQIDNDIRTFSDVKPSLSPNSSTEGFRFHEREYIVKDSLSRVWYHYIHTNPGDAWNAGKLHFGMLFSKNRNELVYPNDKVEMIETGQVVYLNLNIMKGIKNLATAFEIIKVDNENGVIEFSYVEDNLTQGKQQLNFIETTKGYTKIIHRSYFKSNSVLRDHFLYPYFHTRMTNTYHRNMKRMYKASLVN